MDHLLAPDGEERPVLPPKSNVKRTPLVHHEEAVEPLLDIVPTSPTHCPTFLMDSVRRTSSAMRLIASMMPTRDLLIPGFRDVSGVYAQ